MAYNIGTGMAGIGQMGLLGGLAGFMPGYGDPTKGAMNYLDQMNKPLHEGYDPYAQQGQRLSPQLEAMYGQMMNDPNSIIARLGQGYQQSPGYNFQMQQAMQTGNNAAAAGGMIGTPQHQQQNMTMANNLANQDYDQYLQHVLGMFNGGLSGTQGLENQGFQASTGLADALASILGAKAGLSFQGAQGQNIANAGNTANLFSGMSGIGDKLSSMAKFF
jgi:hypothetical protein